MKKSDNCATTRVLYQAVLEAQREAADLLAPGEPVEGGELRRDPFAELCLKVA